MEAKSKKVTFKSRNGETYHLNDVSGLNPIQLCALEYRKEKVRKREEEELKKETEKQKNERERMALFEDRFGHLLPSLEEMGIHCRCEETGYADYIIILEKGETDLSIAFIGASRWKPSPGHAYGDWGDDKFCDLIVSTFGDVEAPKESPTLRELVESSIDTAQDLEGSEDFTAEQLKDFAVEEIVSAFEIMLFQKVRRAIAAVSACKRFGKADARIIIKNMQR